MSSASSGSYSSYSSRSDESSFSDESSYSDESSISSGESSDKSGVVDAACVVANTTTQPYNSFQPYQSTAGRPAYGTAVAATGDDSDDESDDDDGDYTCLIAVCLIFLLLGGGAAAAYFLYFKEQWAQGDGTESLAPSEAPTGIWYEIPTLDDCIQIANNETVDGQDDWGEPTLWDVEMDISLTEFTLTEDYGLATSDLRKRLQTIMAPELSGCLDVEGYEPKTSLRRSNRRRLNPAKYIVGNTFVNVIETLDKSCDTTIRSELNCFSATVQLDVYIKGVEGQSSIRGMISQSFADFDILVRKLDLSIAYDKMDVTDVIALSVRDTPSPTAAPSPKPTPPPKTPTPTPAPTPRPTYDRLGKIKKALSGFNETELNEEAFDWVVEDEWDPEVSQFVEGYDTYWIDRYSLVTLYFKTVGPNWINSSEWLTPTSVCDGWFGITCDEDKTHVTGIDLGR